jgi:hypothetical protein
MAILDAHEGHPLDINRFGIYHNASLLHFPTYLALKRSCRSAIFSAGVPEQLALGDAGRR